MADLYVNSDELKEVASSMKLKANNIMEAYQNDASTAILSGSESIQISGLDTTQVLNSFNKIFTNLSTRINTLSEFLINTVANEYDNVSASIRNEFDNDFANEISKLLGISLGTGSGATSVSNITNTTTEGETNEWKWNPNLMGSETNQNTSSSTVDSGTQNNGLVNDSTQNSGSKHTIPEQIIRPAVDQKVGNYGTKTSHNTDFTTPTLWEGESSSLGSNFKTNPNLDKTSTTTKPIPTPSHQIIGNGVNSSYVRGRFGKSSGTIEGSSEGAGATSSVFSNSGALGKNLIYNKTK